MHSPLSFPLLPNWKYDNISDRDIHYQECIVRDIYQFRNLALKYNIDYLINIGGNVGTTDVAFNTYFPNSKIITLEPCSTTFEKLKSNTSHIKDIVLINKAFGYGQKLKLIEGTEGKGWCRYEERSDGNIETMSFKQIWEQCKIPPNATFYLKIDCEGGEKYLTHQDNINYFAYADFVGIEYHLAEKPPLPFELACQIHGLNLITHKVLYQEWHLYYSGLCVSIHNKYNS